MNVRKGIWSLADPKISITSAAGMLIACAAAQGEEGFSWGWLAVTGTSLFGFEVAKNAWGDIVDFDSGTDLAVKEEDRTAFSGGKRVLVDGLLTRRQTWQVAAVFAALGVLLGLAIVTLREPKAIWFGIVGAALAWSYHGPPLKLAYRGFGELAVAIAYGPVVVLGTFVVQTGRLSSALVWLAVPLGLFIAGFLLVNEFPDHDADKASAKRNLVVRLGKRKAALLLVAVYASGFAVIGATELLTNFERPAWFGAFSLVPAVLLLVMVLRDPRGFHRSGPVQPLALLTFVIYSVETAALLAF